MKKWLLLFTFSVIFLSSCSEAKIFYIDQMRDIRETPMPIRTDTFANTYTNLAQHRQVVDISGFTKDGNYITFDQNVRDIHFFGIQNKQGYLYTINYSSDFLDVEQFEVIYLSLGMEENEEFELLVEQVANWDIRNMPEEVTSYYEVIKNNGISLSINYSQISGYSIFATSHEEE